MLPFRKEIDKLAHLCRISCSPQAKDQLAKDLEALFNYFQQLQEVDTEGVAPCYTTKADEGDWMRDDVCSSPLSRESFLNNAAEHIGGMIKVPSILKP
jgi:aspartyl-tRNA(Asn)/glutamyl-tRNA(Gln) amidotransferase subunit C